MKIAITFLLLGLAGSALSLPNLGLDTKPVTNAKPDSNKSDDQILEDVTVVKNSVRDLLIRILKELGCILEELLDEMSVDDEQKDLIRKGFETGDWTGLTTTYGQSLQPVVSGLVQTLFNVLNSFIGDLEGGVKKDLVKLGLTLDGPQPTHQKKN